MKALSFLYINYENFTIIYLLLECGLASQLHKVVNVSLKMFLLDNLASFNNTSCLDFERNATTQLHVLL
jgi:hypothetical protein